MNDGRTPLHWASTEKAISALAKMGCLPDAQNHRMETALPLMVRNNNCFDCAVALLSSGANPNQPNGSAYMPLHLAISFLKLLTVKINEYPFWNLPLIIDHWIYHYYWKSVKGSNLFWSLCNCESSLFYTTTLGCRTNFHASSPHRCWNIVSKKLVLSRILTEYLSKLNVLYTYVIL